LQIFIREKLDKGFEIFSGRGRKLLDDRIYVRDKLKEATQDVSISCILKEIILYAPADCLEGLEIVDLPGAGRDSQKSACYSNYYVKIL